MAQVFAKLFQNRKNQNHFSACKSSNKSSTRWHVPRFGKENINLVIFKDHAMKGRQCVLDSRCIRKLTLQDLLCEKCRKLRAHPRRMAIAKERCPRCVGLNGNNSPKYKNDCTTSKNDIPLIGEMLFGTAPLANSATTLKVHWLKNPHQIMLSLAFPFVKRCEDSAQSADFDELSLDFFESSVYGLPRRGSDNNLSSQSTSLSSSVPMDMPRQETWGSDNSLNQSVTSSGSFQTPLPSPSSACSIVSGSKLCLMRRLRRSWNRSLQNNSTLMRCGSLGASNKSSLEYESPQSSLSEPGLVPPCQRRSTRIGLAVIFSLDEFDDSRREFETFFFSHVTLIEGQLAQLRAAVEKSACEPRDRVTSFIMEALERFQQNVYDLYTAQRLPSPVWLSMMASSSQRSRICDKFVKELTTLIDRYDSSSTNNFVSALLTGVLMYHLAWVPTVTPSGEAHSSYADKHSAKWLDMLAKSHPYNPLWAQLSDMHGAIGLPPRLARTVITGKKTDTIVKFLFVLSYFIRCSEIHETFDECYDEEYVLTQIESAVDEICIESMENEAADDEFVLVDPPQCSNLIVSDFGSDSGLVSQSTEQSKVTRRLTRDINSESGFTELHTESRSPVTDVKMVPSSSPADKVREWLSVSQSDQDTEAAYSLQQTSGDEDHMTNFSQAPPDLPPACVVKLAPDPRETNNVENVRALGRAATVRRPLTEISAPHGLAKMSSFDGEKKTPINRQSLVRMFSSEIEQFDEYYVDGKPPMFNRQSSIRSTSMFDEYFSDDIHGSDSLSQQLEASIEEPELATPTNNTPNRRAALFKVVKEAGFHQSATSSSLTSAATYVPNSPAEPVPEVVQCIQSPSQQIGPLSLSEDPSAFKQLSLSKQSSRCSTPQTIKNGGATTPTSDPRCRHVSTCHTVQSEDDPFANFTKLNMPRSKVVSRLADTSVSTTSFGRQQLASFSDHYLSDFVLHGTSEDNIIKKVQRDLVSSVEHSVLEDPISEAVCVLADTERWTVNVCSSMSKQPKPLKASHLVSNMVETVSSLSKLKMSSEFILLHMEDRLQEMFFKSRMLAEYIQSRKKVDMDELDAMFGLEANDIRFLLSVASTHSTLNIHGIY